MPIVNRYEPDQAVLGDVIQQGAHMQALGQKQEREAVRLQQARKEASDKLWQSAMLDKRADINQQQYDHQVETQAQQRQIQQAQDLEYQRALGGLKSPEEARDRAMKLQQLRMKLNADAEMEAGKLQDKKAYQEFLGEQAVKNYNAMSIAKQQQFDKAVTKRDLALAAVDEGSLTDKDKQRMKDNIGANYERQWGHIKKPPEKMEVNERFKNSLTDPDKEGNQYYYNGKGWEPLDTGKKERAQAELKAAEIKTKSKAETQKLRVKLIDAYMRNAGVDERGNPRMIGPEELNMYVDSILGPREEAAPQSQGGEQWDYNALYAMAKGTVQERRWALRKLKERADAGDKEALSVAQRIAQETN